MSGPYWMVFRIATGAIVHARWGRTKQEAIDYAARSLNKTRAAVERRYEAVEVEIVRKETAMGKAEQEECNNANK